MSVKNKIFIPTLISSATYQPVRTLPHIYFYNGLKDCEDYYIQHYPTGSTAFVETSVQNKFPYLDYYDGLEPSTGSNSLLFFNETPPYGVTPNGSLFTEYWDKYVSLLYNPRTRLIKASAIIPLADYFEMELNDIVQWRGNYYHLRAINDYNLKNGTCKLELLGPIIRDAATVSTLDCSFYFSSSFEGIIPTTTTSTTVSPTTSTTTLVPTTSTTTLVPTTSTTTLTPTTSTTTLVPTTSTTTVEPTTSTTTLVPTTSTTTLVPTTSTTTESPITPGIVSGSILYLQPSGYNSGSGIWEDYSGYGNDAIVSGSTLVSQSFGWQFNGTDNYLTLPNFNIFNLGSEWSWQAYFEVDSTSEQTIWSKEGDVPIGLPNTPEKQIVWAPINSYCECNNGSILQDNKTNFGDFLNRACLIDNSTTQIVGLSYSNSSSFDSSGCGGIEYSAVMYQNNQKMKTSTCVGGCEMYNQPEYDFDLLTKNLYIGKSFNDDYPLFSGILKAYVLYNRNLTEAELMQNYNYFTSSYQ